MKLKKLLKGIPIVALRGPKDVAISGLCSHSKFVSPGNLFIAKKGISSDGARHIPEAVAAGAAAILTDLYDPFLEGVTQIIHPNPGRIEAELAARYYSAPSAELLLVGVTGTSGKSTCSYLIRHLLDQFVPRCGLIGGVEWIVGEHQFPALYTTPDILTTSKLLRDMVQEGCHSAVMEVSSHALHQGRTRGLDFDVAIFTQITPEHLDYHLTMEEYAAAKAQFFTSLGTARGPASTKPAPWAVLNADCPWSAYMVKQCPARWITYGIDRDAALRAHSLSLSAQGTLFDVEYAGKSYRCSTALIGRFNVYNLLAVLAFGTTQGFPMDRMIALLAYFPGVPGRLERIPNDLGFSVFVDHAHKADALENVLSALRAITTGRLHVVFGCGGNRDPFKRPQMGRSAEQWADHVIVTSDNPRYEDPETIIQQILAGMEAPERAVVHLDRKQAIRCAIQSAQPGDVVLIAGRGHETVQLVAGRSIPCDDRVEAAEACLSTKIC